MAALLFRPRGSFSPLRAARDVAKAIMALVGGFPAGAKLTGTVVGSTATVCDCAMAPINSCTRARVRS
jgi:hypothetical protein